VLINRDDRNCVHPTIAYDSFPRRSLQCASLPLASFEAPLSCLRAHPKHQGLAATSGVCAVFLGNEEKVFVIYVEQSVGLAIALFKQGTQKERPLTSEHGKVATIGNVN